MGLCTLPVWVNWLNRGYIEERAKREGAPRVFTGYEPGLLRVQGDRDSTTGKIVAFLDFSGIVHPLQTSYTSDSYTIGKSALRAF